MGGAILHALHRIANEEQGASQRLSLMHVRQLYACQNSTKFEFSLLDKPNAVSKVEYKVQ